MFHFPSFFFPQFPSKSCSLDMKLTLLTLILPHHAHPDTQERKKKPQALKDVIMSAFQPKLQTNKFEQFSL